MPKKPIYEAFSSLNQIKSKYVKPSQKKNRLTESIGDPTLEFEISESNLDLEDIIKKVEKKFPDWKFNRTEKRYDDCVVAVFEPRVSGNFDIEADHDEFEESCKTNKKV